MSQRYYIAVPKKIKNWGYQTILSWKNYSYTGTLREAQERAIKLFIEEEHISNVLNELIDYFDENEYNNICDKWDELDEDKKYEYCKPFYDDYLKFEIDDVNKGLTLWDYVSNDEMKNYFDEEATFVELE